LVLEALVQATGRTRSTKVGTKGSRGTKPVARRREREGGRGRARRVMREMLHYPMGRQVKRFRTMGEHLLRCVNW
jgi:hypothetical protein